MCKKCANTVRYSSYRLFHFLWFKCRLIVANVPTCRNQYLRLFISISYTSIFYLFLICLTTQTLTRAESSSSLAQEPLLSQGLLQKLLPAVPIPCSIPPISLPQLAGIFHHTIFPSQFRPAPLSSSFRHCNENSSCRALFLLASNMSCPF